MARGIIPAIILMALCAGLACGAAITCTVGTAVPPQIRVQGYTELAGDVTAVCSGGTPLTATSSGPAPATATSLNAIPQMTVVVTFNTAVTSRILGAGGLSEAVLLIDEPGAVGLSSYGSTLPISVCPTPLATAWQSAASPGCQEWVGNIGANSNVPVLSTNGQTNTTPGYNAFPGVASGNTLTFYGVPMLAPGPGGSRVFRITNVRVNANGGALVSSSPLPAVTAALSATGAPITFANSVIAAYATSYMGAAPQDPTDTTALTPPVFQRSSGVGAVGAPSLLGYLRFAEGAEFTFRTRLWVPYGSPPSATIEQDIPGAVYNSESGLTPYAGTTPLYFGGNTTQLPGLADSGTRVKAVFHNIPLGATIYAGTGAGGNSTSGYTVRMVSGPSAPESAPPVAPTITMGGVGFVQLQPSGGSATATWEVITTATNPYVMPDNFDIPVAVYAAPGAASPGTATVNMSYAPTLSDIQPLQFMPEFTDTSTAMPLFTISGSSPAATPLPSSLILILCGLGALLIFAAGRKFAAR